MEIAILVLFLLLVKHYVCDFPLQSSPWMYLNKGTFGHPGGIVHSLIHVVGSFLVLIIVFPVSDVLIYLLIWEFVLHYLIDYLKIRCCRELNYTPINGSAFWIILGLDQLLHQICYLVMTYMLILTIPVYTYCPMSYELLKRLI